MMKPYKTVLHAFLVLLSVGMPLPLIVNVQSADATEASTHHPHMRLGAKRILTHTSARTTGPMVQLDQQGRLHLVWTQDDKNHLNLYYLQAHLDDKMFPYPVRVNPNDLPVTSLHEPPTLALSNDKTVFLTWTTPHPQANGTLFASLLELSRSIDGGKTFLAPVQVNDDTVVTSHAFDSLAVAQNGTVQIAWIDAREGNKDPSTYTARSLDQGQSITTNLKLDEQTCVCCRTTVTTGLDGTVYVAWRKIFPGNIREVVVARSTDNGTSYSSAVIVGHDQWMFLGCPHRPASLGVDANGRLSLVWYTEGPDETPGIYFSISQNQGQTFTPRKKLNTSTGTFPDHPQIAVDSRGRILVVWEEHSPVRREVVMSYSLDQGQHFSSPQRLNRQKAKHPTIAMNTHGQAVVAWLERVAFPDWSTVLQPVYLTDDAVQHPPSS